MSPTTYKPTHQRIKVGRQFKPLLSEDETARRKADKRFYNSRRWKATRRMVLQDDPMCVMCERERGELILAADVDHIVSRARRPDLELELSNLQPLCKACHSRKTATEDGGLGNRRQG